MPISSIKKATLFINLSILGATGALSLNANASDAVGPGDSESQWVVGAAVGASNNPYIGESNHGFIVPTITYNGERFFIKDDSINLHIAKTHGFSVGLIAALDAGFLVDDSLYKDNEKLAGLSERDGTILGGVYINHDTSLGRLSFSALSDLADKHDGHVANLKYTFDLEAGNWNINPVIGVQWLSDEFVNHHAGVSANEATAFRTEYRGKASTNAFAGIRARYDVTENWDVNLETGVTKLGSGFSNSSIIDDDLVYQASVGINYNF
jgi:outer membrane protein